MRELEAATAKEHEAEKLRQVRRAREDDKREEHSGDETEGVDERDEKGGNGRSEDVDAKDRLKVDELQGNLKKRRSLGEQSYGELSTDSEWDKVGDSEGDIAAKSSQEE